MNKNFCCYQKHNTKQTFTKITQITTKVKCSPLQDFTCCFYLGHLFLQKSLHRKYARFFALYTSQYVFFFSAVDGSARRLGAENFTERAARLTCF